MKRTIFLLSAALFTITTDAGELCNMFGYSDVLCQSEKLSREIEPVIREIKQNQQRSFDLLLSRCEIGDQAACNRLNAYINSPVPKERYMNDWARSFDYGQ